MIERGKKEGLLQNDTLSGKISGKNSGKSNPTTVTKQRQSRSAIPAQTSIDASDISRNNSRNLSRKSPTKLSEVGIKFNRGMLRSFDKSTGGFVDKEFTQEFSVSKTSHFLARNVGIRDDMSVSDVSVAQSNSIVNSRN